MTYTTLVMDTSRHEWIKRDVSIIKVSEIEN